MVPFLKKRLTRFRRDEGGSIAAEAALMFPLLLWTVLASYVYFEAFRNQSVNTKAAYTISDALSRETEMIDNTYLTSLWRLHEFLTNSAHDTGIRVTVVEFDGGDPEVQGDEEYLVSWSREKGDTHGSFDSDLIEDSLPVMPDGETVIVVQTWVVHEPVFSVGLDAFEFEDFVVTRPRFAPNGICYSHNGSIAGRICPVDS